MSDALPVSFTRRASRHIEEAGRWWRENREKAPDALTEELTRALELIASRPEVGAIARNVALPRVRRVLLGRVNYHLYYRVKDTPAPSIQVIAFGTRAEVQGRPCECAARGASTAERLQRLRRLFQLRVDAQRLAELPGGPIDLSALREHEAEVRVRVRVLRIQREDAFELA